MQEYYFYGNRSQIHGFARLSPRVNPIGSSSPNVVTLADRRQACKESAFRDAQARFLALTLKDPEDQREWARRLEMGATGAWAGCFKAANISMVFFEPADLCRAVVQFPCLPGDF